MDYRDVTVVIPVKNEPAAEKVTRNVLKTLTGSRVIVIYSGRLDLGLRHRNLKVVRQVGNGKGVACVQAAKYVRTPIMCFIDGDGTYDVGDLKRLVAEVRRGADMAIGNRFGKMREGAMPAYVKFGNRVLTVTGNLLYGLRIDDSQTGSRAMKTEAFRDMRLKETNFGIETEMNVKAKKRGYKIVELPINYYIREGTPKHSKPFGGLKLLALNFKLLNDP
jgi:dolichol-phosphate mannosyltransferase